MSDDRDRASTRPATSRGELQTTVLRAPEALDQARELWRSLWARSEPRPPMLEYEWARRWWSCHGHRGDAFLVRVDDGAETIGLAPLYVRRREGMARGILRTVCVVGTGEPEADEVVSENNGWLCAPGDVARVTAGVAAALRQHRGGWDALDLRYLGPHPGIAKALVEALGSTLLEATVHEHVCHGVEVRPFDDYVAAIGSASRRARYRRGMRRADEAGVELVRARDTVEALGMFEALVELHGRHWAGRGESGACHSDTFRSFHRDMIEHYAASGRLWLFGLRHQGRWIGLHYDIEAGDTLYYYLAGIDTEAAGKLAPGNLMLLHAIDLAAASGLRYLDLLAGAYDFKAQLATSQRSTFTVEALNRNGMARGWRALRDLKRRARGSRAA